MESAQKRTHDDAFSDRGNPPQNNTQDIYYKLVQENGQPFMNSSVDDVSIPLDAHIVHLRKQVWKDNETGLLKGISAASLQVFKNSFCHWGAVRELGQTEEQALLVLVPDRSSDRVSPPGTLESLKEKITAPSSFAKAREKSGWVETLMKVPDGFVCHRMPKETVTFPVHLFVEEFGQFLFDIGTIEVNEDDIMKTMECLGPFPKKPTENNSFMNGSGTSWPVPYTRQV